MVVGLTPQIQERVSRTRHSLVMAKSKDRPAPLGTLQRQKRDNHREA